MNYENVCGASIAVMAATGAAHVAAKIGAVACPGNVHDIVANVSALKASLLVINMAASCRA